MVFLSLKLALKEVQRPFYEYESFMLQRLSYSGSM
ncbi:hypothetical protein CFP56_018004 [Quercus suber]|uniref:Uncharacterized protein n=1 Tax=Quercus suber TaxID=58331 RepID=A0AAW0KLW5_QUESU